MTHHGPGLPTSDAEYLSIARETYPAHPVLAARLLKQSIHAASEFDRNYASQQLVKLSEGVIPETALVMLGSRVKTALDELDRLQSGDFSKYVSTGIPALDRRLGGGGLRRGEVTLLAAPSGAGKTTAVVQMSVAAASSGLAIVVSPEMSPEDLVTREVVRRSGVPKWHRAPWVDKDRQTAAAAAHAKAASSILADPPNVAIYDARTYSLEAIFEEIRLHPGPVSLVALDYAQQLADDDGKKNRYLAVGEVASRSIDFARERDCAVVVTSQVNTIKDKTGEKSYTARESANLEQKSATVLYFIVDRNGDGMVEKAEFRATKVRDGALFRLEVDFNPAIFSIKDKTYAHEEEHESALRDWTQSREP